MALDEYGYPYIGVREGPGGMAAPAADQRRTPRPGAGVVSVENATHKVTRGARFWALAHYSKHVKRGARVFGSDGVDATGSASRGSGSAVTHVAFRNPDGSFVVVLTNRGPERRAQLLMGSSALDVNLPADSVHTLQWT
jgi:glucosylceramidase